LLHVAKWELYQKAGQVKTICHKPLITAMLKPKAGERIRTADGVMYPILLVNMSSDRFDAVSLVLITRGTMKFFQFSYFFDNL
jgi:hypothetical protein